MSPKVYRYILYDYSEKGKITGNNETPVRIHNIFYRASGRLNTQS